MARVWGILRVNQKIASDAVAEVLQEDLDAAVDALCRDLDIPRPIILRKHRAEYMKFFRTHFNPDDFIDSVAFARFEVEVLRDRKKKDAGLAASDAYE